MTGLESVGGQPPVETPGAASNLAQQVLSDASLRLPDSARWDLEAGLLSDELLLLLLDLTAAYPVLTTTINERVSLRRVLQQTGAPMWTLLLPAAVGLWVLADPIAVSLVGADGADFIASATKGFAVSLAPFAAFQLLSGSATPATTPANRRW